MRKKGELESVFEQIKFETAIRHSVIVKEAVGKNKSGVQRRCWDWR